MGCIWLFCECLIGLRRRGKSCRLRWINYLSPNVKRGDFSEEEDDLIIRLHNLLGNRFTLAFLLQLSIKLALVYINVRSCNLCLNSYMEVEFSYQFSFVLSAAAIVSKN